jgi:aspartate/methionine/tyrosine aminotransferase
VFSSRLHWNLDPNPVSKLLVAKRAAGEEVLDLTESNPADAGFDFPDQEILQALADPRSLRYAPIPAGLPFARQAVCEYYSGRIDPDRILLTTSTSEAYAYLFKLLTDPGDNILTPRPSYPLFEFLAGMELVSTIPYALDFEDLDQQVNARTRAIIVVNPNNPTGSFVKRHQLERLVGFCQQHDLAIISDEVFADYGLGDSPTRIPSFINVHEVLTFSLSGLSKVAGLPQMKLGWIAVSGPADSQRAAIERLELIADTYLSVSTPVQWAAPKLLELGRGIRDQITRRTTANLRELRRALGECSSFRLMEAEGGWYAVIEVPRIRTEEEWLLELLEQDNVLVQPGYFYDFEREAFLILSLLTPLDNFREGVQRLLARA